MNIHGKKISSKCMIYDLPWIGFKCSIKVHCQKIGNILMVMICKGILNRYINVVFSLTHASLIQFDCYIRNAL